MIRGNLLIRLYGLAWTLARPILRRNRRLRDGFNWRLVPDNWAGTPPATGKAAKQLPQTDVWIQAASGGEAYLAWEIVARLPELRSRAGLKDDEPLRLLVTTWTRQGLEILQAMATTLGRTHPELSIRVTFFPLDTLRIMDRALTQARPKVVALLETELWPGLMLACAKRGIPILVLNGRMTDKSLRQYRRLKNFSEDFWKQVAPHRIAAISPEDGNRFAELFGSGRVEIVTTIKFDRAVPAQYDIPEKPSPELAELLPDAVHGGRTILLASVRAEEEEAVMSVLRYLRTGRSGETLPTIIIAPRHMHRVQDWLEHLRKDGISPLTRAGHAEAFPAEAVIVWDTFGELGRLYRLADAVFVGGSLAPLGGQNFLEPLGLGRIPCCGPSLDNFAWALQGTQERPEDTLEARGLLQRCPDAHAVAVALKRTVAGPHDAPEAVVARFHDWLAPRLGGARRCAELILQEGRK